MVRNSSRRTKRRNHQYTVNPAIRPRLTRVHIPSLNHADPDASTHSQTVSQGFDGARRRLNATAFAGSHPLGLPSSVRCTTTPGQPRGIGCTKCWPRAAAFLGSHVPSGHASGTLQPTALIMARHTLAGSPSKAACRSSLRAVLTISAPRRGSSPDRSHTATLSLKSLAVTPKILAP
jgi:hypothetical protein